MITVRLLAIHNRYRDHATLRTAQFIFEKNFVAFISEDVSFEISKRWYDLNCQFVSAEKMDHDLFVEFPDATCVYTTQGRHEIASGSTFKTEIVKRPEPRFIPDPNFQTKPNIERKDHQ